MRRRVAFASSRVLHTSASSRWLCRSNRGVITLSKNTIPVPLYFACSRRYINFLALSGAVVGLASLPKIIYAEEKSPEVQDPVIKLAEIDSQLKHREAHFPDNLIEAKEKLLHFLEHVEEKHKGEVLWRLSYVFYWLGMLSPDLKEQEAYFKEGLNWGKLATEAAPEKVESHTWYVANMGMHGTLSSLIVAIWYQHLIEKHATIAVEIDARYNNGLPARLLGRFYQCTFDWPLGNGDKKKGRALLERAMKAGPDDPQNYVWLAHLYTRIGLKEPARALLNHMLTKKIPQSEAMYWRSQLAEALHLLQEMDNEI